jgi:hypothetical protein
LDALLAILYSSNLLLSLQGVQQPCEDPSVDSSLNSRTQRVLFSCACLHMSQCPPGRVSFHRTMPTSRNSSVRTLCALLAPAQCPLGRALRILSDSGSSLRTHSRVLLLNAPLCICSMPTWQSFTELLRDSVCNCVLLHSLASKVFNNLEVFP